ncbi:MAG: AAA family ATPase, partial [Alphaproteobacteria bacterium]|nr:AAA family ATPase [Alphaproteobacteria bacterium]
MARATHLFVCQACGTSYAKWQGKCDGCNGWNSLVEEVVASTPASGLHASPSAAHKMRRGARIEFVDLASPSESTPRWLSQNGEFDRVTGGGLVPGSAILIGGDPGIGKSTLLLQIAAKMGLSGRQVAYLSGEESIEQIRMRAQRLGYSQAPIGLAAATLLADIIQALDQPRGRGKKTLPENSALIPSPAKNQEFATDSGPDLVIIDSIQTIFSDQLDSAPGTVGQVRHCAQELIRIAKKRGFVIVLVGHVTKEGAIAGPRVLEHMVDAVLYFEGDRGHHFRILRAVKNRFGPSDEIGVFEMTGKGLEEIANPSALFLGHRNPDDGNNVSGTAIFAGME